jgi:predicted metal-binding membrane protein
MSTKRSTAPLHLDDRLARRSSRSGAALLCLGVVIAWSYLVWMAWGMHHMDVEMALMPAMTNWQALDLLLVWVMWALMMAGMMLPSATPMLLGFAAVGHRVSPPRPTTHSLAFAAGYLLVWTGFSATATLVQWFLLEQRLVSPMMEVTSRWMGGVLLVGAGAYQFTHWKVACLGLCRAPMDFLVKYWRPGTRGALAMGLRHGAYCLGCCWALMALLFVLGVMNLLWIVALTLLVLAEKTLPRTQWVRRIGGGGLCGWGLWILARAAT